MCQSSLTATYCTLIGQRVSSRIRPRLFFFKAVHDVERKDMMKNDFNWCQDRNNSDVPSTARINKNNVNVRV